MKIITKKKALKGLNAVDMHHHSTVSDGIASPDALAKIARKWKRGICLTDHNAIKGSVYLCRKKGVFSVPSVEITTKEGKDILVYFYKVGDLVEFYEKEVKAKIRNNRGFNMNKTAIRYHELMDKVVNYNGLTALAHPLVTGPKKSADLLLDKEFLAKLSFIESHNHISDKFNQTMEFVKGMKKPLIAGSDSHIITRFEFLTCSHAFDTEGFLESIKRNNHMIFSGKSNNLIRCLDTAVIFFRNLRF